MIEKDLVQFDALFKAADTPEKVKKARDSMWTILSNDARFSETYKAWSKATSSLGLSDPKEILLADVKLSGAFGIGVGDLTGKKTTLTVPAADGKQVEAVPAGVELNATEAAVVDKYK
ncbi:MAG: hypothetical protein HC888_02680 [Candidatus Competibacteraceae bacterium]|nr:hypothetical protein [Candidatus Competibacteraceae bacterium]